MRKSILFLAVAVLSLAAVFVLSHPPSHIDPNLSSFEVNNMTSIVTYTLPNNTVIQLDRVSLVNSSCTNGITAVCTAYLNITQLANPQFITQLGLPLPQINSSPFMQIKNGKIPSSVQTLMPVKKSVKEDISVPSYSLVNVTGNLSSILGREGYVYNGSMWKYNLLNGSGVSLDSFYSNLINDEILQPSNTTLSDILDSFSISSNGTIFLSNATQLTEQGYVYVSGFAGVEDPTAL